jgi:His-Xaa-Ser repeat protein HxsA
MKLIKSLFLFISSLSFLTNNRVIAASSELPKYSPEDFDPVSLRPLNLPSENLFAAHRSHSSHSSHRSSSGGGYSTPSPQKTEPPAEQPTDPGRAAPVSPTPAKPTPKTPAPKTPAAPALSLEEKRKLQIMRIQIALAGLGLHTGSVNGVLDDSTKEAIRRFQVLKGLDANGLMTTETLNALGIPAVQ